MKEMKQLAQSHKKQSLFFQWPEGWPKLWWEVHPWQSTIVGPLRIDLEVRASQSRAGILNLWAPDQYHTATEPLSKWMMGEHEASSVLTPHSHSPLLPLLYYHSAVDIAMYLKIIEIKRRINVMLLNHLEILLLHPNLWEKNLSSRKSRPLGA